MVMPEMITFDTLYLKRPLLYVMLVIVGSNPESPFWGKPNSDTGGEFKMPVATLALPVDSCGASGSGCTED